MGHSFRSWTRSLWVPSHKLGMFCEKLKLSWIEELEPLHRTKFRKQSLNYHICKTLLFFNSPMLSRSTKTLLSLQEREMWRFSSGTFLVVPYSSLFRKKRSLWRISAHSRDCKSRRPLGSPFLQDMEVTPMSTETPRCSVSDRHSSLFLLSMKETLQAAFHLLEGGRLGHALAEKSRRLHQDQ